MTMIPVVAKALTTAKAVAVVAKAVEEVARARATATPAVSVAVEG